jgi:tetratricopeptide (TPR) repeat protein
MRHALFVTCIPIVILTILPGPTRAQKPERPLTPSEQLAASVADLRGTQDLLYGSDGAAQFNRMLQETPAARIVQSLRLPSPPPPVINPGTASVSSFRHPIPKAAVKAYQQARKLGLRHKYPEAAELLEKAVAIDPDYAEAHMDLGALYLKLDRPDDAGPHLRRAVALDPTSSFAHSDLSAIQLLEGDLAGAERSARRALQLSAENDWARFVLGAVLLREPATYREGLQHLESASRSVPAARRVLSGLKGK